jgi:hypothetical protein
MLYRLIISLAESIIAADSDWCLGPLDQARYLWPEAGSRIKPYHTN